MIEMQGGKVIITTVKDLVTDTQPVRVYNLVGYELEGVRQIIERCNLWIHIDNKGNECVMKDRTGTRQVLSTPGNKETK